MLDHLNLDAIVPNAGSLLSGVYPRIPFEQIDSRHSSSIVELG
jgi:hypothetical protein